MSNVNDNPPVINGEFEDLDSRNYVYDGLADDDSWVENTNQFEEDLIDIPNDTLSSSTRSNYPKDLNEFSVNSLDFTLHTIVEESCEDSELEYINNNFIGSNAHNVSPSDIERYFFGFEDQGRINNCLEDSSSEIFSELSDEETTETNDYNDGQSQLDLNTSKLEEYFLSQFMGYSVETKSDNSVGSDSEGQPSPSQRKKKLRARRTPRSNHSSFDNLLVETADAAEQSDESFNSSESDTNICVNEVIICDKLSNTNPAKRRKNFRKRDPFDSTTSSIEFSRRSKSQVNTTTSKHQNESVEENDTGQVPLIKKEDHEISERQLTTTNNISISRTDSFNNWSSDEETNLMMSKMRQFFKSLLAIKTNNPQSNNSCIPTEQQIVQTKNIKFPYFESELIRLMKTVPSLNNQQLREIVEYFSSEDAWSDSNDSSDKASSDIAYKNREHIHSAAVDPTNNENTSCILGAETALMYTNLLESFIVKKSKTSSNMLEVDNNKYDNLHISKSVKTGNLLVNIWQHIGQKLINLMHEESIMGTGCGVSTESFGEKCNFKVEQTQNETLPDNRYFCLALVNQQQQGSLLRSKSQDLLLGPTNRSWNIYSNSPVNENTGDSSDCDRFSWRGSFESALLAPGDSRNKLLTSGRENGSHISQWSLLKRVSADNLYFTSAYSRNNLNRVQSCGSISGNDGQKSIEAQKMWSLTDISNKFAAETSLTRSINENLCTNSLPVLQSFQYSTNEYGSSEFQLGVIQSTVKSARYRSPVIESNLNSTLSKTKTKENQAGGEIHYGSSLHKNTTSASSTGHLSFSESSRNISDTTVSQQKLAHKRNTNNFRGRSESLTSLCSNYRYANVKINGQVEFGMQYNYKINALEIHVVQCKNLASVGLKRCKSDPYVKIYLLPDLSKSGKRKTKVKRQTLNPVFNETLRFHMPISKLKQRSIWLTVWNSDLLGRNDFLGEVVIDLKGKVFDKPQSQWYTLQEKSGVEGSSLNRGDLVVALKFILSENSSAYNESNSKNGTNWACSKGKLQVLVKEAKYVQSNKTATCDTFCKSYLLPNSKKNAKQKTHVIKKSLHPMWNFTFVYEDLTIDELSKRALELTVWDHDRLISNQLIGGVRFSLEAGVPNETDDNCMEFNDKETYLWREMMNRPNFWVEGSVKLRSNLNDKRYMSDES